MTRVTRRSLLSSGAAFAGAAIAPSASFAQPVRNSGAADLVVLGGNLLTIDPAITHADALAVRGEHLLAVGSSDDIRELMGDATKVIDVHIRTLRRKIDDPFHAKLIQTVRGAGYRLSSREP